MTVADAMMASSPKDDDRERVVPPWLRSIASANLYSSCATHRSRERNYYCRACMLALCRDCMEQHHRSGHEIITAYKASHAASFRMEDLKQLWDVSGICPYTFNGWLVAFIRRKGIGTSPSRCKSGVAECVSCQYGLKTPGTTYCSVECKVEAALKMSGSGRMKEKAKRRLETILEESADDVVQSFRKRARKQEKPQRAPLH